MNAIAPIAEAGEPIGKFGFKIGKVVLLGDPASAGSRVHVFQRRVSTGDDVSRLEFIHVAENRTVYHSDMDLALMMAEGHFSVPLDDDPLVIPKALRSALTLTDAQKAQAAHRMAYVELLLAVPEDVVNKRDYVEKEAKRLAALRKEGNALSYNTIVKYHDIYLRAHHLVGDVCLVSRRNPGRVRPECTSTPTPEQLLLAEALQYGLNASLATGKGTGQDAFHSARVWLADRGHDDLKLRLPDVRTFQRRLAEMDRYIYDALREGPRKARRKRSAYYEQRRPDFPLEEVEVDHTTLDVFVFDEKRTIVWGRPDIIVFKDRATGIVLGYSIGFESPSYASFMQGLRHAMYPKDLSRGPKGLLFGWPYFGKPKRLLVDNALHFVGNNIRSACAQLGIEKVEFRPGNPWLKGELERLNGIIAILVHKLPGTTFSNVQERKEFAEIEGDPALTLRELDGFLMRFFADDYNVSDHQGLGPLRTMIGNPARKWRENLHKVSMNFLPDPDLFLALAGDKDLRAVTHKGVRWDYLVYQSAGLNAIRNHPEHREGSQQHPGTQYAITRDPYDMGKIYVHNPYAPESRPIVAEAVRGDYANGLTLHQHEVHKKGWQDDELRAAGDGAVDLLLQARDERRRLIDALRKQRTKANIARLAARYIDCEIRKEREALKAPPTVSAEASSAPIDPAAPERVKKRERRSKDAMDSNRRPSNDQGAPDRMDVSDPDALPRREDPASATLLKPPEPPRETKPETESPRSTGFDIKTLTEQKPDFDE